MNTTPNETSTVSVGEVLYKLIEIFLEIERENIGKHEHKKYHATLERRKMLTKKRK